MDIRINSKEQEKLVLENIAFVHYIIKKLNLPYNDYEDAVSIGTIGLIKAAITFDESKEFKFITYAAKCIRNEILMDYRKAKKVAKDISINKPLSEDKNGNILTLEDTIEDPKSNFFERIVSKDNLICLISVILNYLKGNDRLIMLYRVAGLSQCDIAKELDFSQSYISRVLTRRIRDIKNVIQKQVHYEEVFFVELLEDQYRISFENTIENLSVLQAEEVKNLPLKVDFNRERIVVQMPAFSESFYFFAEIIKKIDESNQN